VPATSSNELGGAGHRRFPGMGALLGLGAAALGAGTRALAGTVKAAAHVRTRRRWWLSLSAAAALIGPAVVAAPADAAVPPITIVFQANEQSGNDLFTFNTSDSSHTRSSFAMAPNTSPVCAVDNDDVAYFAAVSASGYLAVSGYGTLNYQVASGTSPALAIAPNGMIGVAFQGTDGHLWFVNLTTGAVDHTPLGMASFTSPSIASWVNGSGTFEIAFQAGGSSDHLYLYDTNGSSRDTGLGMAYDTSPAIDYSGTGAGFGIAFNSAGSGHLWLYETASNSRTDTGLGMAPGSSPSIAPWANNTTFEVAFNAAGNGHLWLYDSAGDGSSRDTGLGMQTYSSPDITQWKTSVIVSFQAANSGHLYVYDPIGGNLDSGLGMQFYSNPSNCELR
jgi:hypothetical protein